MVVQILLLEEKDIYIYIYTVLFVFYDAGTNIIIRVKDIYIYTVLFVFYDAGTNIIIRVRRINKYIYIYIHIYLQFVPHMFSLHQ